jgi:hypothetical protein
MAGLIVRLRKELAGQGLDAGPDTICWHLAHHQVTVSSATISRYLMRAGLVTSEPRKRPRSSYIRFAAGQPNECWQSDFTHYPLADGTDAEILTWLDDHSRYSRSLCHVPRQRYTRVRTSERRRSLLGTSVWAPLSSTREPAGSESRWRHVHSWPSF